MWTNRKKDLNFQRTRIIFRFLYINESHHLNTKSQNKNAKLKINSRETRFNKKALPVNICKIGIHHHKETGSLPCTNPVGCSLLKINKNKLPNHSVNRWTGHKWFMLSPSTKCSPIWALQSKNTSWHGSKYLIYSVCQAKIKEERKRSLNCFKSYYFKIHKQLIKQRWVNFSKHRFQVSLKICVKFRKVKYFFSPSIICDSEIICK